MQKLIVGFMLSALSALFLVGIGSSQARAVDCPYTGCVSTDARINGPARAESGLVTFRIRVVALSGTAKPKGHVVVKCHRDGKTKVKERPYRRHARNVSFHLLKRVVWSCSVRFSSDRKFKASRDRTRVHIV